MHTDTALELLLPWLQNITNSTLWIVDENALPIVDSIQPNPLLTLVSNRYDIYCIAKKQKLNCIFSDFNLKDYTSNNFSNIVYRISKEKAIVHHIMQQALLLGENSTLIMSGFKQEGIKGYSNKLLKAGITSDKLQKRGSVYLGQFKLNSESNTSTHVFEDETYSYHDIQKINCAALDPPYFYSKPGIFGWNKIDKGTELLLTEANTLLRTRETKDTDLLDLGCGYGWIILNADKFQFNSICATDNNAAAIIAARENAKVLKTPTNILVSDCADTITRQFDFIFCNPPFHQGFKHSQALTKKFIVSCKNKLKSNGKALFVLNEFVSIDNLLKQEKLKSSIIKKHAGFKVILIEHQLK